MAKIEIKGMVLRKIEHLKAKVEIKELQLEVLLDITNSINSDFSIPIVINKFKYFVKDQLKIEKLVLFSKLSEWQCLLHYGLNARDLEEIDIRQDLLSIKEITSVNLEQKSPLKIFDIVIPVFQGEKPLAYLLLGDVSNDRLRISKLIKHLNFLQLLTNLTVTAIENQRLAQEVLKQEMEKREFIEKQNEVLEGIVKERTKELRSEKEESERLLYNILPEILAQELKLNGFIAPLRYEEVTVLFTDFKGFTRTSANISPQNLVGELNEIFQAFDFITEKHSIEKIKTIGDSYMAVCGIPTASSTHSIQAVRAAFDMIDFLEKRKENAGIIWEMRVGIHSGPLVAGVVGTKKFTYDVWGDTVNIASRMESSGVAGKINISEKTFENIQNYFDCQHRGKVDVKGKGAMNMYFVNTERETERYRKVKIFILEKLKRELPENLFYHGVHHTIDVCNAAAGIALKEKLDQRNTELVKVAALFHDSGFIKKYSQNETIGCEIAREFLPLFDYSRQDIELVCGMIMATRIPQSPKNLLEQILADADLDYLGRVDFFNIGNTLFEELNIHGKPMDLKTWNKVQREFLSEHSYFTQTSCELRKPGKQKQLEKLISMPQ